jgi:XTP/dITP diphosphohydrolase
MKKPLSAPDPNREAKLKAFDRMLTVMDELRENCPCEGRKRFG